MLSGTVNARLEPTVDLEIRNPGIPGQHVLVPALLDTGFNGYLKIDTQLAAHLGLKTIAYSRAVLADGTSTLMNLSIADVLWHGNWRKVLCYVAAGGTLVGTRAFMGSLLIIEMTPSGIVHILT